jgi:hypothetical protein
METEARKLKRPGSDTKNVIAAKQILVAPGENQSTVEKDNKTSPKANRRSSLEREKQSRMDSINKTVTLCRLLVGKSGSSSSSSKHQGVSTKVSPTEDDKDLKKNKDEDFLQVLYKHSSLLKSSTLRWRLMMSQGHVFSKQSHNAMRSDFSPTDESYFLRDQPVQQLDQGEMEGGSGEPRRVSLGARQAEDIIWPQGKGLKRLQEGGDSGWPLEGDRKKVHFEAVPREWSDNVGGVMSGDTEQSDNVGGVMSGDAGQTNNLGGAMSGASCVNNCQEKISEKSHPSLVDIGMKEINQSENESQCADNQSEDETQCTDNQSEDEST